MGVDYNSYLGPYIEAKNSEKEVARQRRSCTNVKCAMRSDNIYDKAVKFCSRCASPIGDVTYMAFESTVNTGEIYESTKLAPIGTNYEPLIKNTDLLIGNLKESGREFGMNARDERIVAVDAVLIAEELANFIKQYENDIAWVQNAYGKDNVTIKWGLIQYAS